jgi:hypothetical protein
MPIISNNSLAPNYVNNYQLGNIYVGSTQVQGKATVLPAVSGGLILYYNASQQTSYPENGGSWYNIVTSSISPLTQINNPTFSSDNGGILNFNGTNQSFTGSTTTTLQNELTLQAWVKTPGEPDAGIFGIGAFSQSCWLEIRGDGNMKLGYYDYDVDFGWSASNTTNQWVNIAGTISGSGGNTVYQVGYVNGIAVGNNTESLAPFIFNSESRISIANAKFIDAPYVSGSIAQCLLYNKALSAAEILSNYNASKTQYGL